jgi:hypothetical protein
MMPVEDIKKMRYLTQDWNSPRIAIMSDGSGRHVASFSDPRELESVLRIIEWAVIEHERRQSR